VGIDSSIVIISDLIVKVDPFIVKIFDIMVEVDPPGLEFSVSR
jgi:hypothetical protein